MAELFPGILLDIVDDEWLLDRLPHDDIPFPAGVTPPADEIDESNQEQLLANQEKWTELGLRTIQ